MRFPIPGVAIKAAIVLFAFTLIGCSAKDSNLNRPNVLLINVDDLGWADLGYSGSSYYETPNVDKLSKEGVMFTNAYASGANCAPSRANMLTGLYGPRHGMYTVNPAERGDSRTKKLIPVSNVDFIADSLYTLGKMFRDNGYMTGVFGKWHVSEDPKLHGFAVNVGGGPEGAPGKKGYFSPYHIGNIEDGPEGEYLTDRLAQEAIQFIEQNQNKPFFLYLPFYTVHTPIMGKDSLVDKFKNKPANPSHNNPEYAAMIYSMDENVGRILNKLKELGLENNTIVIFTSDNGGIRRISRQDPLRAGKGSYYEGGVRVPLIVKWPNQFKPALCETPVIQMDFYPTLQRLINAEINADSLDGVDISPLLFGESIPERDLYWYFPIYLQAYSPGHDQSRDPLFRTRPGAAIRSGDWKLIEYFEDGEVELYHLGNDISESENLKDKNPEMVRELLEKLHHWRKAMNAPVPDQLNPSYDSAYDAEMQVKAYYEYKKECVIGRSINAGLYKNH